MIKTTNEQLIPGFLTGGGELGELIRNKDWSATPLGPVESWPQSLRTCVRIMLTSSQPMFVWWGKELINLYNDPYKAIVGGKHPEALGQAASVVWREIWDDVGPRAHTALTKNIGTYDEALLLIMERNGYPEETYYTFSYSPVPGDDGLPQGIICANTDDTARITSEREMRTLTQLGKCILDCKQVSEVYAKTIATLQGNAKDFPFAAIYHFENDGAIAKLEGKTTSELEAHLMPPVIYVNDDNKTDWGLQQLIQEPQIVVIGNLQAVYGKLPSGDWQLPPGKALAIPIMQPGQKYPFAALIVGLNPYRQADEKYCSFFRLVADQVAAALVNVRAYEEERKRLEALLEIDRAKTTFFSNISHEFRTPLTLMLGPLEELINDPALSLPDHHHTNITSTHRNALRLLRLVNTLLDFSRIEADRLQASFTPVALDSFTTGLADNFRSAIEAAGLEFQVSCAPLPQAAYVDLQMWEKIVLNLLSNAFKYTLQGRISVRLQADDQYAVLTVQDTGIGIPAGELPHMFERFHRVKNANGRTHEGTGIGLSLVKELVQMHQGKIKVESEQGKGTTFTVTIPLGKEHLPAEHVSDKTTEEYESTLHDLYVQEALTLTGEAPSPSVEWQSTTPTASHRPNVLVVDDNKDMREYIARLLDKQYQVTTAGDGRQALDKIAQQHPDLILSDIMMPVMDGVELLHTLKANAATASIPMIMLSARAGEEAKIEGYDIGADDYVVKPFSARELLARVNAQMKIANTRRETEQHLRNLLQHTPFPVAIVQGNDMIIELANESMLRFWSRTPEQVLYKPLLEVFPEIITQTPTSNLRQVFQTGQRAAEKERLVTYLKDGLLHNAYYNAVYEPVKDDYGHTTHIIIMTQDVTDLVSARQLALSSAEELEKKVTERTAELNLSNELLVKSNHELEQFAYIASHDLQEPLRKIQVFAGLLKDHLDEHDTVEMYFEKINTSAQRMSALIRDVLHYSRLSKTPDQLEPVNLNKTLQQIVSDFDLLAEQKNAVIQVSELPVIQGVPLQLLQLFTNLVGNSLKFADKPRPVIDIQSHTMTADEIAQRPQLDASKAYVMVCVSDNGIGFEQQYAEQIFIIFQRLNDKQTYTGTGIGLALCKKIVENHHGFISAHGEQGKGATFEIIFPIAPPPSQR